jgi:hypothetical protein
MEDGMSEQTFDDRSRCAAPTLNRRFSLAALGAVTLTATGRPVLARKGQAGGKAGKKARDICKRQRGPCAEFVRNTCANNPDCVKDFLPCCECLARCNFAAFFRCGD